jgi:hypothetical protein
MGGKLLIAGFVAIAAATADDRWGRRDGRPDPGYGRDRGGYGYGQRYADPVSSAMRSLQQIGYRARVDGHEADHFRNAMRDLDTFQERWSRGRFDRGKLNNAIGHIEHLADAHQLHPRDRAILRDGLRGLYSLREGGGRNGYGRVW